MMSAKTKVLFGDNESGWGDLCAAQLDQERYVTRVVERDAIKILDSVFHFRPQIIILETYMQHITSIGFMELARHMPDYDPHFIIINSDGNIKAKKMAMEHGAAFYLVKPFSFELVCVYIDQLSEVPVISVPKNRQSFEEVVTRLIWKMNIPPHLKGYNYLRKAIVLAYENPALLDSITKGLYPAVAQYYATNVISVERALRNAVTYAWNNGTEVLKSYFGPWGGRRPSNSRFIATVIDHLRLEYNGQFSDDVRSK